jgi:UDP-glucuronate 4-epimerase
MKRVLITGSAGFIGSALSLKLLSEEYDVVGIDNFDDYYDPKLKHMRISRHKKYINYTHKEIDISKSHELNNLFKKYKFNAVVNLAAQAGVRYSLKNPLKYINTNILGFTNILEACKDHEVKHLVFASSSSVYGLNENIPFSTNHSTDHPTSIYAASKKSNELLAHAYSHLYNLPTTGLRFFTVYGPWDRPDMALQSFTKSIIENKTIKLYNYGKHRRDFTFIDDIVEGIYRVLGQPVRNNLKWNPMNPEISSSSAPYRIYNIGNNNMIELDQYINLLEKCLGLKAKKEFLPLQAGDVLDTYADVNDLIRDFNYQPKTSIEIGIPKFVEWYLDYYKPRI